MNKIVRTKTGNKIHRAPGNFSRTYCGIRYAGLVKLTVHTQAQHFCRLCGMSTEGVEIGRAIVAAFEALR